MTNNIKVFPFAIEKLNWLLKIIFLTLFLTDKKKIFHVTIMSNFHVVFILNEGKAKLQIIITIFSLFYTVPIRIRDIHGC